MKCRNVRTKKCTFLTNVLNTFKNSNQSSIAAKRGGSFSTMTRHSCCCQPFLVPQYFNQAQSSLCILYISDVQYSALKVVMTSLRLYFAVFFNFFWCRITFQFGIKVREKVYQILNSVEYISVFSFENTHQREFFCLASDFCLVQFNCFRLFWNNSRGKKPSK